MAGGGNTQKLQQVLSEVFDAIDEDHQGYLDERELMKVLSEYSQQMGGKLSQDEIKRDADKFIAALDTDRNGRITKEEFVNFFMTHYKSHCQSCQ